MLKIKPPENIFSWIKQREGGSQLFKKFSFTTLDEVTRTLFDADIDSVQDLLAVQYFLSFISISLN